MNLQNAIKFFTSKAYRQQRQVNVSEHRELQRLRNMPRGVHGSTMLCGKEFHFSDARTFISSKYDIFHRQLYKFNCSTARPFIIDAGANVGMSVIYFKYLFPEARIIAFEPDQALFELLNKNIASHQLQDVETYPYALWKDETELSFFSEGKEAGRITTDSSTSYKVQTKRLSSYINEPVHLLKIDIEGAENQVVQECKDKLHMVDKLFVEFHSYEGQTQELSQLIGILEQAGFRLHIQDNLPLSDSPFCHIQKYQNIDMLLNIFSFKSN